MQQKQMTDSELVRFFKRDDSFVFLQSYPNVLKMFEESAAATVYAMHKLGSLKVQCGEINISTSYGGEAWSGKKSFDTYKTFMQAYVEKLVHDKNGIKFRTELSKARNDICLAIYNAHKIALPNWPSMVTGRNPISGFFEISARDSYKIDNMWVLWQAVGSITVTETAKYTTYDFSFSGNPEIKIALVDLCQLDNLETLLAQDFLKGQKRIMDRAAEDKVIVNDWSFLD